MVCWHRHEISQTPKERSRTVTNRTISVANSDRHCVRWHGQEIFLATTPLFRTQCERLRRPAETTCLQYPYRPTEATKTPLSCCDNVRHSLLLHFQHQFRKSTAQSLRQPKSAPNSGSLCMQWLFMNHAHTRTRTHARTRTRAHTHTQNYAEMSLRISPKEEKCASGVVGDICRILCSTVIRSVCTLHWNKNINTFWIDDAFYILRSYWDTL